MSGVDVLAVLDREIEAIRNTKQIVDYSLSPERQRAYAEHLESLIESRAAVGELIEAIKPLAALDLRPDGFDKRDDSQPVYARDNTVITVGDVRRAAAALARCRGGAE